MSSLLWKSSFYRSSSVLKVKCILKPICTCSSSHTVFQSFTERNGFSQSHRESISFSRSQSSNVYPTLRILRTFQSSNNTEIKPGTFAYFLSRRSLSTTHGIQSQEEEPKSNEKSGANKVNEKPVKDGSRLVYYFKQLRFVGNVFMNGIRNLGKDVKIAVKTRRKIGIYDRRDYSRITREELRHMRQTKDDVKKTIPVAVLFMIPFFGYFAPVLAYVFPRQLLSQQFWHPDQKDKFVLEEYEKRSQYYLPLIKEIAVTCKEDKSTELYKLCMEVIKGTHPSNAQLLNFKEDFARNENFSLRSVPRYHLVKLCKCWLIPTGWFLPRWYLMKALRRRITRLHEDDMLILNEGVPSLPPASIGKAVHVRGMDNSVLNLTSQVYWLSEWVDISSQVSATDVSFLAHCAAFKAANFESYAEENNIDLERLQF